MSKSRRLESPNIYLEARKKAKLSRMDAYIAINSSNETLSRTEHDKRIPHPDEVLAMARAYGVNSLIQMHCRLVCPIGREKNTALLKRQLN